MGPIENAGLKPIRTAIFATFFSGFSILLLSGCGENQPLCSGQETIDTLRQIIDEQKHLKEVLKESVPNAKSADYGIVDIITTEQSDKKAACKASVTMTIALNTGESKTITAPSTFTYTTERTDEGKIYVTASGL